MSKNEINAFLGVGTEYEGTLHFKDVVRIDGKYKGTITSEGSLVVGKEATIVGELRVGELVLSGSFTGDVFALRNVHIYNGGSIEGTVNTPVLVMEQGGVVQGQVNMRKTTKNTSEENN